MDSTQIGSEIYDLGDDGLSHQVQGHSDSESLLTFSAENRDHGPDPGGIHPTLASRQAQAQVPRSGQCHVHDLPEDA